MAAPAFNPLFIVIPAIAFAMFRRVRTSMGRQPVIRARMIIRMVLFTLVCTFAVVSLASPVGFAGAAVGLLLGVILARVGLMHTTFEAEPGRAYYTPNRWLGLVVVGLFFVRFAMRAYQMSGSGMQAMSAARPVITPQQSALTLGSLCLMAGYYIAYYAWVMAKTKTLAPPLPPAA